MLACAEVVLHLGTPHHTYYVLHVAHLFEKHITLSGLLPVSVQGTEPNDRLGAAVE